MNEKEKKKKYTFMPSDMDAVLAKTFFANNMGGFIRHWRLLKIWKRVVGDKLFEKTEPSYIKDNVLFVKVSDPSWAHELSYLKDEILTKLSNNLKGKPIKDIRFFTGSVRVLSSRGKKKFDLSKIEVDEKKVKKSIDQEALKDHPKLRQVCENFIKNSYRRRKHLDDEQSGRSRE